jgi:ferritin-like protein
LLQFFEYAHLPPHLQVVSKEFHALAHSLVATLPENPERTAAVRKLLEAKDCAVRAAIFHMEPPCRPI